MIIDSYKIGTSFEITCSKEEHKTSGKKEGKRYYQNFGIIKKHAYMWAANQKKL